MELSVAAVRRISSDFAHADLGDLRRSRRVGRVVGKLARRHQVSLPEAMGSEAELEGAYRLMNNQAVTFDLLHEAHAGATVQRAESAGPLLAIHDTTTCHFPHADPAEVGYLNTGKPGFFLHYTLLVPRGSKRPLGTTYAEPIFRARAPKKRSSTRGKRRVASGAETRKKKNREFERWGRGIAHTSTLLPTADVLHIADRETDSYELMADCIQHRHRFVFRVRMKNRGDSSEEGLDGSVGELVETTRGVLTREVAISRRKSSSAPRSAKAHPSRTARAATLHFASTRVELRRPRYMGSTFPATLSVNVVRVWEPKPPKGHEPIEWLLYTTEPIESPEDVSSVVDAYRARWLIEECNKALKSGCLIEERQFES